MSLVFAWSWDGPSPTSGWTSGAAFGVAAGRHGDAATFDDLGGSSVSRTVSGATHFGFAQKSTGLTHVIFRHSGTEAEAKWQGIGDGRYHLHVGAYGGGEDYLIPFIKRVNRWNFFEQHSEITLLSIVDNGDGTSTVTINIGYAVRVNNEPLLSGTFIRVTVRSNPVPLATLNTIEFTGPGGGGGAAMIDDIYADNSTFQGDGIGSWDGASEVYDPSTAVNPRITQKLIEVGVLAEPPNNRVRMSAKHIEVGVLHTAPNNRVRMTAKDIEVGIRVRHGRGAYAFIDELYGN